MQAEIGLVGLGTMGAALALNIAEKGFDIAVFNRTTSVTRSFAADAGPLAPRITPCEDLPALVAALKTPRAIILMVPAGAPVDQMIAALRPLLDRDDLIIDCGNANFHDTRRRAAEAEAQGSPYLGVGVSGGEEGARHGPSIMGGGPKPAWDRVAPILEAIAARFDDTPCATWMGPDGAGHFVKSVHNGIEYADMQMIAEIYGIMRDGLAFEAEEVAQAFEAWNRGPLKSYLIEITGEVARAIDPDTGLPVIDIILDRAGQKGTGRWTAIEAQHLGAPATAIEAAVAARNISARIEERAAGADRFHLASRALPADPQLDRPPAGGAPRRQDRLLRPGLRPPRRRLDRVRLVAAHGRHRPGLARRLHHPLGAPRRHGPGARGRPEPQPHVRAPLRRDADPHPRRASAAWSPRRRCRASPRRRWRRRSATST